MSDFLVAVVNSTLHSLDLVKDLDALSLIVLNGALNLLQITTQIVDNFILLTDAVLMITLARADLVFKASNLSLQVTNDFLKNLEVSLTSLMILDFFAICVNNTVSSVVR